EKFSFYLQAFKYGMPPHGGSATGLERITARMLNLSNVKEATLFPRDLNRIDTLLSTDEKKD
ncbi:MAG TPA: amino acid--tRNA ligase-related protein, partial [Candidatus Paceibacterota bacterium]|nr:amino acid--tRNA ligase-related protein [Candidatus Paceibacterota bacterium]